MEVIMTTKVLRVSIQQHKQLSIMAASQGTNLRTLTEMLIDAAWQGYSNGSRVDVLPGPDDAQPVPVISRTQASDWLKPTE
jgi:hypothetical protein